MSDLNWEIKSVGTTIMSGWMIQIYYFVTLYDVVVSEGVPNCSCTILRNSFFLNDFNDSVSSQVFFFFFFVFLATLLACGSSQSRGRIRAAAAGLHQRHSNTRSKPCLWSTLLLMAMLDPLTNERGQESNLHSCGY